MQILHSHNHWFVPELLPRFVKHNYRLHNTCLTVTYKTNMSSPSCPVKFAALLNQKSLFHKLSNINDRHFITIVFFIYPLTSCTSFVQILLCLLFQRSQKISLIFCSGPTTIINVSLIILTPTSSNVLLALFTHQIQTVCPFNCVIHFPNFYLL